jgi:hypothetical protein
MRSPEVLSDPFLYLHYPYGLEENLHASYENQLAASEQAHTNFQQPDSRPLFETVTCIQKTDRTIDMTLMRVWKITAEAGKGGIRVEEQPSATSENGAGSEDAEEREESEVEEDEEKEDEDSDDEEEGGE